jgi:hypothetical protein
VNFLLYHTNQIPIKPLPKQTGFATLKTSNGTPHCMSPDTHATIEVETPPVPALDAGAGRVVPQPPTRTPVFSRFPILENLISGARRCTKVHGGVLRSPGRLPLGRPAWPSRPCKTEHRSSFGKVLVKFPAGGSARPLDPSGRAPKGGDKTRQNIPKRAKPCFGDSKSLRSAFTVLGQSVRFGAGSCPRVGGARNSFSVIGGNVRSSLVISMGEAGVADPGITEGATAPAPECREDPPKTLLELGLTGVMLPRLRPDRNSRLLAQGPARAKTESQNLKHQQS